MSKDLKVKERATNITVTNVSIVMTKIFTMIEKRNQEIFHIIKSDSCTLIKLFLIIEISFAF